MLRKITLPLFAAGFVLIGIFGASDGMTDAHSVQVTPTGVPSVSPTMTATVTPIPFGTASPMQTATPPADPEYPIKPHPAPTTTP